MSLLAHSPNTSKTCKPTAINNLRQLAHKVDFHLPENLPSFRKVVLWVSLLTAVGLGGCASVRPIVKIGLIAPFEGLYRESGYAALDAMRQAMTECTPEGIDVLPLALDDSGDPAQARRAAQKLLADPQIVAVVGPLLLDAIPAISSVITHATEIPWYIPPLGAPENPFNLTGASAWLEAQVDYVATNTSATRVLLLGLPAEWQLAIDPNVATMRLDDLDSTYAALAEGDALLWLGRPDVGAAWLAALRPHFPDNQFWLASQAGIDIFALQSADRTQAYWMFWSTSDYNPSLQPDDSAIHQSDALRYSTYRATCAALHSLVERAPAESTRWELHSRPIEQPRIP